MAKTYTVATEYTDELAHTSINGNLQGKVTRRFFSHTFVEAADAASTAKLCPIPKGARVVGGKFAYEALGAAVTGTLGDGTTPALYGALTSMAAPGAQDFAVLVGKTGLEAIAGAVLTLTTADQAISAGKKIAGWVDYILP